MDSCAYDVLSPPDIRMTGRRVSLATMMLVGFGQWPTGADYPVSGVPINVPQKGLPPRAGTNDLPLIS
jgi:hypothetical protein